MIAQGIKTMKPTEIARHIASMPNTKIIMYLIGATTSQYQRPLGFLTMIWGELRRLELPKTPLPMKRGISNILTLYRIGGGYGK